MYNNLNEQMSKSETKQVDTIDENLLFEDWKRFDQGTMNKYVFVNEEYDFYPETILEAEDDSDDEILLIGDAPKDSPKEKKHNKFSVHKRNNKKQSSKKTNEERFDPETFFQKTDAIVDKAIKGTMDLTKKLIQDDNDEDDDNSSTDSDGSGSGSGA